MKRYLFLFLLLIPMFAISQTDFDKAEKLFLSKNFDQSKVVFQNYLKENPTYKYIVIFPKNYIEEIKKIQKLISDI